LFGAVAELKEKVWNMWNVVNAKDGITQTASKLKTSKNNNKCVKVVKIMTCLLKMSIFLNCFTR